MNGGCTTPAPSRHTSPPLQLGRGREGEGRLQPKWLRVVDDVSGPILETLSASGLAGRPGLGPGRGHGCLESCWGWGHEQGPPQGRGCPWQWANPLPDPPAGDRGWPEEQRTENQFIPDRWQHQHARTGPGLAAGMCHEPGRFGRGPAPAKLQWRGGKMDGRDFCRIGPAGRVVQDRVVQDRVRRDARRPGRHGACLQCSQRGSTGSTAGL